MAYLEFYKRVQKPLILFHGKWVHSADKLLNLSVYKLRLSFKIFPGRG